MMCFFRTGTGEKWINHWLKTGAEKQKTGGPWLWGWIEKHKKPHIRYGLRSSDNSSISYLSISPQHHQSPSPCFRGVCLPRFAQCRGLIFVPVARDAYEKQRNVCLYGLFPHQWQLYLPHFLAQIHRSLNLHPHRKLLVQHLHQGFRERNLAASPLASLSSLLLQIPRKHQKAVPVKRG